MTRKDYEMIAEAVKDASLETVIVGMPVGYADGFQSALELAATYIADGLSRDNPRFNRARFMAACGFPA